MCAARQANPYPALTFLTTLVLSLRPHAIKLQDVHDVDAQHVRSWSPLAASGTQGRLHPFLTPPPQDTIATRRAHTPLPQALATKPDPPASQGDEAKMKRLLASKLSIPVLAAEETKLEQVRGFALALLCPPPL